MITKIDLSEYIMNDGKLRSYTPIGGYPLFYVTDNNCLCSNCADNNDPEYDPIVAVDVNWENSDLYCDECSARIDSAYADND